MDKQFQRGLYAAAYGLSGAINDIIQKLECKKNKRLADYQKTLGDIKNLCRTKLNNPDFKAQEDTKCK